MELSEIVATDCVQLLPHRAASVVVHHRGRDSRQVSLRVEGARPTRQSTPDTTSDGVPPSTTSLYVRLDKQECDGALPRWPNSEPSAEAYFAALDSKGAWIPATTPELLKAGYVPAKSAWQATIDVSPSCGARYSLYLEEREPIVVDRLPDAHESVEHEIVGGRHQERVVYSDRLLLRMD
jgi:hypothetical protein